MTIMIIMKINMIMIMIMMIMIMIGCQRSGGKSSYRTPCFQPVRSCRFARASFCTDSRRVLCLKRGS